MPGLWTGTSINTNETAMVFNQLANRKAFHITRRKNGFLYAVLGKDEPHATPGASEGFKRLKKVTGNKIEVRVLGDVPEPGTTSDGLNEIAEVTLENRASDFGAQVFDLAHYTYTHAIPHSAMDRFAGNEAKTLSYLDEIFDQIMLGYEKVWGTALGQVGSAGAPSRTSLGSWPFAIAGTTPGTTWGSYGTIDRADQGNTDFRGHPYNVGDLTLAKIRQAQNDIAVYGGDASFGCCKAAVFGKLQSLVENMTVVDYDEVWSKFGGRYVRYAGTSFTLDHYAPDNVLGLFTPSTWGLWKNDSIPLTKTGVINDPSRVATYVVQTGVWMQLICMQPNQNAYLYNITG